jgi:hypothetical protein
VIRNGGIRWGSGWVNESGVLENENVGLEEIDDGVWAVYIGPLLVVRFDVEALQLQGGVSQNEA